MFQFDVNREYNNDGDLLIHVAIKGGKSFTQNLYHMNSQAPSTTAIDQQVSPSSLFSLSW